MIFSALFAILIGVGMIAQWVMSYLSKQIPELRSEPIRIAFHIAAEILTALMLISSGIGLFFNQDFFRSLFLIAIGMLLYTAIVSPGYFAQKGNWHWIGIFALIIVFGVISVSLIV